MFGPDVRFSDPAGGGFLYGSTSSLERLLGVTFTRVAPVLIGGPAGLTVRFSNGSVEHWIEAPDAIAIDPNRELIEDDGRFFVPLEPTV